MSEREEKIDAIERAICAEQCAFYGEPPCWSLPGDWPNPDCNSPGCHALAMAAADAAPTGAPDHVVGGSTLVVGPASTPSPTKGD